ncbi:hypothetical protein P5V15_001457 [Pogonomyrmex californicus]
MSTREYGHAIAINPLRSPEYVLEMQATRSRSFLVQTTFPEILFAMRQRRGTDERMPFPSGKRPDGRGRQQHTPAGKLADVEYTPRPHIRVRIGTRNFSALIDTGSEISMINSETARYAQEIGCEVTPAKSQIHLADGALAHINGKITLPLTTHHQDIRHPFQILPTLDSTILIGIDLWARLRLTLLPPSATTGQYHPSYAVTAGLARRTPREERELTDFLNVEMAKFEGMKGPTDRITHVIRVKTPVPIKQ